MIGAPRFQPAKKSSAGKIIGISIAVVVVIAILGGAAAIFATVSDDQDAVSTLQGTWNPVTSKSGRYTLRMPANPSFSEIPINIPNGPTLTTQAIYCGDGSLQTANVGLMFLEEDLSPTGGTVEQFSALFDNELSGMAKGSIGSQGGTVTGTTRVDSPIGPAGRFTGTLEKQGYVVEGFGVLDGSTFVSIVAIVPEDKAELGVTSVDRAVASLTVS